VAEKKAAPDINVHAGSEHEQNKARPVRISHQLSLGH